MAVISVIIELITLWLKLRNPTVAAEYMSRINAIKLRMKTNGAKMSDLDEVLQMKKDIEMKYKNK